MSEFQTVKNNLPATRIVSINDTADAFCVNAGEALIKLERFSFTANNVTYGASGDMIGYWKFFPPAHQEDETFGLIPVWGMGEIVASQCEDVKIGERVYGYFPPAHFLKVTPGRINSFQFTDMAAHRAELPPIYNNYTRLDNEPGYQRDLDNHRALLQPLHATSFLLCDSLELEENYGAEQVIIVSASSKTAIGLAFGLSRHQTNKPHIVGVTSSGNRKFVESLGYYDQIVTYDACDEIADKPSIIVDMAGNNAYLGRLHAHLGTALKQSVSVGLTHWDAVADEQGDAGQINKALSNFFFAPAHAQMRTKQWGAEEFTKRMQAFLTASIVASQDWMQIIEAQGLEALATYYDDMVVGRFTPHEGLIITL